MMPGRVLLLIACVPCVATGHDERISMSAVIITRDSITWTIDVGIPGWQKVLTLPAEGTDLTEAQLQSQKAAMLAYLQPRLSLRVNGAPVTLVPGELEPIYEPLLQVGEECIARTRQRFMASVTGEIGDVRLGVRLFHELTASHRALISVRGVNRVEELSIEGPGEIVVPSALLPQASAPPATSLVSCGARYVASSVRQLAFLAAVLIGASALPALMQGALCFALAHALAMTLGVLGVVHVASRLTESLIAASIAYLAAENLLRTSDARRCLLLLAFGLAHGLGSANVVPALLYPRTIAWSTLLAFGTGAVIAQIGSITAAYALVRCLRSVVPGGRPGHWLQLAATTPILVFGVGWLIESVFAMEFMPL